MANGDIIITGAGSNHSADFSSFNNGIFFVPGNGDNTNPNALITATTSGGNGWGADLQFITRPSAGATAFERMRITNSGNVGI